MKTILLGTNSSWAWSPDSQRLAAAANPASGATLLKLFDRNGRVVRSFRLPGRDHGERVNHELVSWSPDGSRLLLIRADQYGHSTVVILDIRAGRLRTFARMIETHDRPTFAWSPNGRLLALQSEGRDPNDYIYAIIDVASGRPILQCKGDIQCTQWGFFVWAPDSKSVFTPIRGVMNRVDLTGNRTTVVTSQATYLEAVLAFRDRLLFEEIVEDPQTYETVSDKVSLLDLGSGHRQQLASSRRGFFKILPLARIP